MTATPDRGTGRVAVLDGLRLLAALSVVLFHFAGQVERGWHRSTHELFGGLQAVASLGWLGVNLFFLISGFVICMSAWGRPLSAFFASRVVRLYPAYWFAIVLTTAFVAVFPHLHGRRSGLQVLANLTMLQSPLGVPDVDPVYWTLWVELHFYLLFAVVVWRGVTYRRVVAFCLLWTVASVVATAARLPLVDLLVGPAYSGWFVAGIVLYLIYRHRPTLLLWGILGVSWVLTELRLTGLLATQSAKVGRDLGWWVPTLANLACFALVTVVALGWTDRLRHRWLTVAGSLTYPLYLIHLEIGWTTIRLLDGRVPPWPLLSGLIAAMLVLAWLVHRFVERPVARLMKPALTRALADLAGPADPVGRETVGRMRDDAR
jgi:peptidoglycan/LPS O-acetylase OafA/YrhL